ncbi:hypothetical protein EYC80_003922 [Monilinia laxa]|uniref:Uncharacterized protein n=1 Tax=Monilinia laxa TaxID=61186 RepID=A0A5N6KLM1_MONLA|nr:hypothetical protein EYC80_003922 [Monilinia laxa]
MVSSIIGDLVKVVLNACKAELGGASAKVMKKNIQYWNFEKKFDKYKKKSIASYISARIMNLHEKGSRCPFSDFHPDP